MDGRDSKLLYNLLADPSLDEKSLQEYVSSKLISVKAERDAAFRERDIALAEKKAAKAARDAAFTQREAAFMQRAETVIQRDAALATLENLKIEFSAWQAHMVPLAQTVSREARFDQSTNGYIYAGTPILPAGFAEPGSHVEPDISHWFSKGTGKNRQNGKFLEKNCEEPTKSKQNKSEHTSKKSKPLESRQMFLTRKNSEAMGNKGSVPYELSLPVPYCSCTGVKQTCLRWGSEGWQSACCTRIMSVYPLPLNPYKKGSRFSGRKMSAGAFQKVLKSLAQQGVDISKPVDLKDHWAKHGSNKYITIK